MASRMAGSLTGKTQSYQGKWYYCKAVWLFFIFSIAFAFRLCVCIRIRSHTALRLPFFAEIHCAAAGLTVWLGAIHAAIQPYGWVMHSSSPTTRNSVTAWAVLRSPTALRLPAQALRLRCAALQPYGPAPLTEGVFRLMILLQDRSSLVRWIQPLPQFSQDRGQLLGWIGGGLRKGPLRFMRRWFP